MLKIIEITPEKGKLNRIVLENGEELFVHTDLLLSEHLTAGTVISPEKREEIACAAARHRSYEYALYCLERRAYSYRELYRKLMSVKHPVEETAVLETLEKLMRLGLLDDQRMHSRSREPISNSGITVRNVRHMRCCKRGFLRRILQTRSHPMRMTGGSRSSFPNCSGKSMQDIFVMQMTAGRLRK